MELLEKVGRLEKEADDFGFRWERPEQIMAQIESECLEIREHLQTKEMNTSALQEEIGDLLHAVFSLCVFCQFSPDETLKKTLEKFEKRLSAVKDLAKERGLTSLEGFPFDELMAFWDQAKELTR
jgi:uncharacterized protein YabN with tetrapyrrole methylase and pyrophosphatase domain